MLAEVGYQLVTASLPARGRGEGRPSQSGVARSHHPLWGGGEHTWGPLRVLPTLHCKYSEKHRE
jgi:hypothetical protein